MAHFPWLRARARSAGKSSCVGLLLAAAACSNDVQGPGAADGAGASSASGGTGAGTTGKGGVSGSSSGGSSAGTSGVPMARPISLGGTPIYTRFMRLTNEQWENSVKDILRLSAAPGLAASFEQPVAGTTDFANNELVLTMSQTLWASYQTASETVAAQATGSGAALSALYTGTDRDGFVAAFGRRVFRRPFDATERQRYAAIYDAGTTMSGTASAFAKGAALVIRAMLQSPYFLYRTELGADRAPLTGYEAASKLSFWLRNTTPNDALLDAAGAGMLDTPEGLASAAQQMLEEPVAAAMMQRFHAELFHFSRFRNIDKAGVPNYTTALNAELEQASSRFFDRIFRQGLGVRDMLTSTTGFVGPQLAPLYGVSAPAGGALEERELGENRTGFFAQVPFLVLYSINADPDSIHRGLSVNLDALCADPGLPQIELPEIPPLAMGQTNRERITGLTEGCGECHEALINPIGFAFEEFDGMGQLRATDNGEPVDTSGGYPFQEGYEQFADSRELMQLMASGKQAHACYAKKLSGFTLQRDIVQADMPLLDTLAATSSAAAGSVKQVMLEIVKNPAWRTRVGGPQ